MSMKMSQTSRKPPMLARDVTMAFITAIASGAAFKTRTARMTRNTRSALTNPRSTPDPSNGEIISTTLESTMMPSSLFQPTDQYPATPYPRCFTRNSRQNTPLKIHSMTTLAKVKSSVSG